MKYYKGYLVFELLLFRIVRCLLKEGMGFRRIKKVDAMGLFTKYCTLCGMKIEKHQDIVKFRKHFNS